MTAMTILFNGEAGVKDRLDKVLSAHIQDLSRARLQGLIADGHVQLNGKPATLRSIKTSPGDHLLVMLPDVKESFMEAQALPLDIVYEDDDVLIVNKAAGMVVHPGAGVKDGTLVNALLAHCGPALTGIGGVGRPGLVHRLDKDTSGIMIVAKSQAGYDALVPQFSEHTIERVYKAITLGSPMPPIGRVDKPIGRHPKHRTRMAVVSEARGGKTAATQYTRLKTYAAGEVICASMVECRLETGRTHQVRVHMASLGAPLVGDRLYLDRRQSPIDAINTFPRQALHAYSLKFDHPVSGEPLYFSADIPNDMGKLVSEIDTICQ